MRLRRTGNYVKAGVLPLLGLLSGGSEIVVAALVIARARTLHLLPLQLVLLGVSGILWLAALIVPGMLIRAPLRLMRRERKLRAAARDDEARAPLAPTQPDPEEALAPGAQISLTRVMPSRRIVVVSAIVVTLLAALASLAGVVACVPAVTTWLTRVAFPVRYLPTPPAPTPLDWLLVAYPVAASLALGVAILWWGGVNRRYVISATDAGITVRRSLHRPRFIPWSDIDVFLKLPEPGDHFIDTYLVHGMQHSVTFFFTGAYWEHALFTHPAGYVRYAADARVLLATIVARSYTPLRVFDDRARSQPAPAFLPSVMSAAVAVAAGVADTVPGEQVES